MKGNSYVFINFAPNYSWDYGVSSKIVNDKSLNKSPLEVKSKKTGISSFLNHFWKRLIIDPSSTTQNHNASISSILEEETNMLISDSMKLVLSQELELPLNSKELLQAMDDSIKIFHEDYPYDFVIVYKENRLGMMILDKCINSKGEEEHIYRFNPHIKSFKGLF